MLPTLVELILDVIEKQEVNGFYFGLTNDLAAAKSKLNCDDIVPLYETNGTVNAVTVENSLIKLFFNHPICSNVSDQDGGATLDEHVKYIYMAVWHG